MLCCMRRTKQVEQQEDNDQKIEQDANKPEDKAHKAATKIQASFRGHIIRKKMKGDMPEGIIKANGEALDNKEEEEEDAEDYQENETREVPSDTSLTQEAQQEEDNCHLEENTSEKMASPVASSTTVKKSPSAGPEVKSALGKTESNNEIGSNECLLSSNPSVVSEKDGSKQADVPAEGESKFATTAKDQEKTEIAATSPVKAKSETVETEKNQGKKTESVEETKPTESAQQESVTVEENKANQESA